MKVSYFVKIVLLTAASAAIGFSASALNISKTEFSRNNPNKIKLTISPQAVNNLDLLFVVDDSGSMGVYQAKLADGVKAISGTFQNNFASTRIAIITTSSPKFFGKNSKVITVGSNNSATDLAENFLVGTDGLPEENVFGNLQLALTEPLLSNENKDFLRNDAHLGIVLVTDTEDQSKVSSLEIIDFLKKLKGNSGFTMNAFVADQGVDSSCTGEALIPMKIKDAVALSSGKVFNICKDDFAAGLANLSSHVSQVFSKTVKLPYAPVLSTIEVKVGSFVLERGDLSEGWVYNSRTNSIELGTDINWNKIPMADMEISFVIK